MLPSKNRLIPTDCDAMNNFENAEVTNSEGIPVKAKCNENETDEEVLDDCFDFDEMEDMIIVDEVDGLVRPGKKGEKKETSKRTAKRTKKHSSARKSSSAPKSSTRKNENIAESKANSSTRDSSVPSVLESTIASESLLSKNENRDKSDVVEQCSHFKDSSDKQDKDVPPTLSTTSGKMSQQYPYRLMFPTICLPRICVDSYIRGEVSLRDEQSTEETEKKPKEKKIKDPGKKSFTKTKETEKKIEDFRRKSSVEPEEIEKKLEEKKVKDSGKERSNETAETEKKLEGSTETKETEKNLVEKKVKDSGNSERSNETAETEKKLEGSTETKETEKNLVEKKVKYSGKKSSDEIAETEKTVVEKKTDDFIKKSYSETKETEKKVEDSRKKSFKDSKNRNTSKDKEKKIGNPIKNGSKDNKKENASPEPEKMLIDSGELSNSAKKKLLKNFKIPRLKKEESIEYSGNNNNLEEQKTKLEDSENTIEDQDSFFIPEKEGGNENRETDADLWDDRNSNKTVQHFSKVRNVFDHWCDDDDELTEDFKKRKIAFENWKDDDEDTELGISKTDSGDRKRKKVSDTRDFKNDNVSRPMKRDNNFAKKSDTGSSRSSFEGKEKDVRVSRTEENASRIPKRDVSYTPRREGVFLDRAQDGVLRNSSSLTRYEKRSRTKSVVSKGVQCDRWKDGVLPRSENDQKSDMNIEVTCENQIDRNNSVERTKDEDSEDLMIDLTDEKVSEVFPILEEYRKAAKFDPKDFDTWTHLLRLVDQGDHIPAACEVYDEFLFKYPYCYGYWRKYANFLKRHERKIECERVFERGVLATPLSVDLWIHYLDYIRETYSEDENRLRELFERSLQVCGFEFRSDNLWETYVRWETGNGCLANVTKIMDRWLKVPTREYITVMDKFIEHVEKHSPQDILSGAEYLHLLLWIEGRRKSPGTDLTPTEIRVMKDKIISIRRGYCEKTRKAASDRWSFEENIKRPYFHIKPLEDYQLDNWRRYLDFEIKEGDKERVTVLFERCLIACALYEEFWIKFADYLLSLPEKDIEKVRVVFTRASTTHHSQSIKIHLKWAQFEQTYGDPTTATSILEKMEKFCPNVLMLMTRRINMLRLRGEFQLVCSLYEQYMKAMDDAEATASLELKYTSLCNQVFNNVQRAYGVLQEVVGNDQTKSLDLPILSNCQHRWFYVCTFGHFHAIYRSIQAKYWNERKGYETGEFVITDAQPGGPRISVCASKEMKCVKVEDDSCDIDQYLMMTSDQNYDEVIQQSNTTSMESPLAKNPITISNWMTSPEQLLQTNQSYFNVLDEHSKVETQISNAKAQILNYLSSTETPTSIEQDIEMSESVNPYPDVAVQPQKCADLSPVLPTPPIMQPVLPQKVPLVKPLEMPPPMSVPKPAAWFPPALDEDSRRKNFREVIRAYNFDANLFSPDSSVGAPSIAVIEPFQRWPAPDYYSDHA